MKRIALYISVGAALLFLSAPTLLTNKTEQGLQAFNQIAPTKQGLSTHHLLQQAKHHQPLEADRFTFYHFPQAHPLVLYFAGPQVLHMQRLHQQTGEPIAPLLGEAWVNSLHRAMQHWQNHWHTPYWPAALALLLLFILWARRYKPAVGTLTELNANTLLLAYASQTGTAQAMAEQLQQAYEHQGRAVHCVSLNALTPQLLQQCQRALFIASTCGDGDTPDNGARFASRFFTQAFDFSTLTFAVLALGDKRYPQFCAFGLRLHQWLENNQARALFAPQTYDSSNGELPTLWQQHLQQEGIDGTNQTEPWHAATLIKRVCLNPNSHNEPLYLLRFHTPTLTWQAGDILCCQIPTASGYVLREYSIANMLTTQQSVELVVRQLHKKNGELGLGSGWLTETLALQSDLTVKVRTNPAFALAPHDAPVILIGAGSGIAGLRSHWQHRATQLAENTWLVYGERHPDNENFLPFLLPETFACISTAFSQCSSQPHYVQDVLVNHLQHVKHWINNGAYLYICGSQTGMGEGVHQALVSILGEETLQKLANEGRYRKDLY
ncbi:MAG TPA: NADPH cytochrome P450 oxidoreductase family protein [Alcanivoracaceae bacterium]|nr:NADPH cytochrome P450 oxidoreductase family protein [Alcanivoracaceae bacterium]